MERKSRNLGGSCADCLTQLGNPPEGVTTLHKLKDQEHMYTCGGLILIFDKTNTIM